MQFLMLIHVDPALMQALPQAEFDRLMRGCFEHADALQRQGVLLASQRWRAHRPRVRCACAAARRA